MATLIVTELDADGVTLSPASAGGSGDVFDNQDGDSFLYVNNGSGSSIDVTFTGQAGPSGFTVSDVVVAVANGAEKLIGPFPPRYFNDANGRVAVSYSDNTSVTVQAFKR